MEPNFRIAVLGFGSLPNQIHSDVYNKTLEVTKPVVPYVDISQTNLNPNSPFLPAQGLKLPVRLGRISGIGTDERRMTCVLFKGASDEPVYFAQSKFSDLNQAIKNLREREGIDSQYYHRIGYVNLSNGKTRSRLPEVAEKVRNWALAKGFHAAIWTDLPEKGIHFPEGSTGREIEPLLAQDPILLANTKKYIKNLASKPNALQQRILNMQVQLENAAYKASLTADFEIRAKPENQTHAPKSEWYNRSSGEDWGPFAAAYPKPAVPAGADPIQWKRDRIIESALYWVKEGIPYSSATAFKVGQALPSYVVPRFMLRGHFPARNCGLDCSNFAAWVYNFGLGIQFSSAVDELAPVLKRNGQILRDDLGRPKVDQSQINEEPEAGKIIWPGEPLQKGDLCFFSGTPKHVVIYLDENHVIESTSAGDGIARVVDVTNPVYKRLRCNSNNPNYLFARRPIY